MTSDDYPILIEQFLRNEHISTLIEVFVEKPIYPLYFHHNKEIQYLGIGLNSVEVDKLQADKKEQQPWLQFRVMTSPLPISTWKERQVLIYPDLFSHLSYDQIIKNVLFWNLQTHISYLIVRKISDVSIYPFFYPLPYQSSTQWSIYRFPLVSNHILLHFCPNGEVGNPANQIAMKRMCESHFIHYKQTSDLKVVLKQEYMILWSHREWINPSFVPQVKCFFGPQFAVFLHPTLSAYALASGNPSHYSNAVYNVLADWNKVVHIEYIPPTHSLTVPLVTLPFALDFPNLPKNKLLSVIPETCLLYFKDRSDEEFSFVVQIIQDWKNRQELKDVYIVRNNPDDYKKLLQKADFVLWVGKHESQPFLLQECLARNIPVLLWDVATMYEECVDGHHIYKDNKETEGKILAASSAPLWSEDCGIKLSWNEKSKLSQGLKSMKEKWAFFKPREFVLQHLNPYTTMENILEALYISSPFSIPRPTWCPCVSVELKGGLGNQLFEIAAATYLSKKLKRTLYLERIEQTDPKWGIVRPMYWSSLFKSYENTLLESKLYQQIPWKRVYEENYKVEEIENYFSPCIQLQGYFQTVKCLADIKEELYDRLCLTRQDIRFQEMIEAIWLSYHQEYFGKVNKQGENNICAPVVIGVHIRFYNQGDGFHDLLPSYYQKSIQTIKSKLADNKKTNDIGDSPVLWLIISESSERSQELLGSYLEEEDNVVYISNNKNELIDFYLLSKCDHFILANSTFSWWSSYLSEIQQSRVKKSPIITCPTSWFLNKEQTENYLPEICRESFILIDQITSLHTQIPLPIRSVSFSSIPVFYISDPTPTNSQRFYHVQQVASHFGPSSWIPPCSTTQYPHLSKIKAIAFSHSKAILAGMKLHTPFLVLEDDVEWYDPQFAQQENVIDFPKNADIVFLGISIDCLSDRKGNFECGGTFRKDEVPGWKNGCRIGNMLGAQAILYVSERGMQSMLLSMIESFYTDRHCDCVFAQYEQFMYTYALKRPLLYQSAQLNGVESSTKRTLNEIQNFLSVEVPRDNSGDIPNFQASCLHPTRSRVVLVTCFFDLGRREQNVHRRNAQEYLEKSQWLLKQNVELVIYIEPDYSNIIRSYRKKYGLESKTHIIEMKFEELPWWDFYSLALEANEKKPIEKENKKDTLLYHVIQWNKFGLVADAISRLQLLGGKKEEDEKDIYCGWIDFGIKHVAQTDYVELDELWLGGACYSNKNKIRIMANNPLQEWKDNVSEEEEDEYLSRWRAALGGGFWMGRPSNVIWMTQQMRQALMRGLNLLHRLSLEDNYLSTIIKRHRNRFSLFYGEYCSILANSRYMHSLLNIPHQLQTCVNMKNWYDFTRIALMFLVSKKEKRLYSQSYDMSYPQTCFEIIQEGLKHADFLEYQQVANKKDFMDCIFTKDPFQWLNQSMKDFFLY